jgi:hypothetical protein
MMESYLRLTGYREFETPEGLAMRISRYTPLVRLSAISP